jgi:hypothetical protein
MLARNQLPMCKRMNRKGRAGRVRDREEAGGLGRACGCEGQYRFLVY